MNSGTDSEDGETLRVEDEFERCEVDGAGPQVRCSGEVCYQEWSNGSVSSDDSDEWNVQDEPDLPYSFHSAELREKAERLGRCQQMEFYMNQEACYENVSFEDFDDKEDITVTESDGFNPNIINVHFLETIYEETDDEIQDFDRDSLSPSSSSTSASCGFVWSWADTDETGSVIYVPSIKINGLETERFQPDDLRQNESQPDSLSTNEEIVEILSECSLQMPSFPHKRSLQLREEQSRSSSVTDSLLQFEILEEEAHLAGNEPLTDFLGFPSSPLKKNPLILSENTDDREDFGLLSDVNEDLEAITSDNPEPLDYNAKIDEVFDSIENELDPTLEIDDFEDSEVIDKSLNELDREVSEDLVEHETYGEEDNLDSNECFQNIVHSSDDDFSPSSSDSEFDNAPQSFVARSPKSRMRSFTSFDNLNMVGLEDEVEAEDDEEDEPFNKRLSFPTRSLSIVNEGTESDSSADDRRETEKALEEQISPTDSLQSSLGSQERLNCNRNHSMENLSEDSGYGDSIYRSSPPLKPVLQLLKTSSDCITEESFECLESPTALPSAQFAVVTECTLNQQKDPSMQVEEKVVIGRLLTLNSIMNVSSELVTDLDDFEQTEEATAHVSDKGREERLSAVDLAPMEPSQKELDILVLEQTLSTGEVTIQRNAGGETPFTSSEERSRPRVARALQGGIGRSKSVGRPDLPVYEEHRVRSKSQDERHSTSQESFRIRDELTANTTVNQSQYGKGIPSENRIVDVCTLNPVITSESGDVVNSTTYAEACESAKNNSKPVSLRTETIKHCDRISASLENVCRTGNSFPCVEEGKTSVKPARSYETVGEKCVSIGSLARLNISEMIKGLSDLVHVTSEETERIVENTAIAIGSRDKMNSESLEELKPEAIRKSFEVTKETLSRTLRRLEFLKQSMNGGLKPVTRAKTDRLFVRQPLRVSALLERRNPKTRPSPLSLSEAEVFLTEEGLLSLEAQLEAEPARTIKSLSQSQPNLSLFINDLSRRNSDESVHDRTLVAHDNEVTGSDPEQSAGSDEQNTESSNYKPVNDCTTNNENTTCKSEDKTRDIRSQKFVSDGTQSRLVRSKSLRSISSSSISNYYTPDERSPSISRREEYRKNNNGSESSSYVTVKSPSIDDITRIYGAQPTDLENTNFTTVLDMEPYRKNVEAIKEWLASSIERSGCDDATWGTRAVSAAEGCGSKVSKEEDASDARQHLVIDQTVEDRDRNVAVSGPKILRTHSRAKNTQKPVTYVTKSYEILTIDLTSNEKHVETSRLSIDEPLGEKDLQFVTSPDPSSASTTFNYSESEMIAMLPNSVEERVPLRRYGEGSDVQVYLAKDRSSTPLRRPHSPTHSQKGVHFSPVVSTVNWRESYIEDSPPVRHEEPQKFKVVVEEVSVTPEKAQFTNVHPEPAEATLVAIIGSTSKMDELVPPEAPSNFQRSKSLPTRGSTSSLTIFNTQRFAVNPGKKAKSSENIHRIKEPREHKSVFERFSLSRLSSRVSAKFDSKKDLRKVDHSPQDTRKEIKISDSPSLQKLEKSKKSKKQIKEKSSSENELHKIPKKNGKSDKVDKKTKKPFSFFNFGRRKKYEVSAPKHDVTSPAAPPATQLTKPDVETSVDRLNSAVNVLNDICMTIQTPEKISPKTEDNIPAVLADFEVLKAPDSSPVRSETPHVPSPVAQVTPTSVSPPRTPVSPIRPTTPVDKVTPNTAKPPLPPASRPRVRRQFMQTPPESPKSPVEDLQSGLERFKQQTFEERIKIAQSSPDLAVVAMREDSIDRPSVQYSDLGREKLRQEATSRTASIESVWSATVERCRQNNQRRPSAENSVVSTPTPRQRNDLRAKSVSPGVLETNLDNVEFRETNLSELIGNLESFSQVYYDSRAKSMLHLDRNRDTLSCGPLLKPKQVDTSRAKSVEYLLDDSHKTAVQPPENELQRTGERQASEYELRVQRSLQKLNIPEWYKPKEASSFRRESTSSDRQSLRWSDIRRSNSRATSMVTLDNRSVTPVSRVSIQTRVRAPETWRNIKTSRDNLLSPASTLSSTAVSPSVYSISPRDGAYFNYSNFSRFGSARYSSGAVTPLGGSSLSSSRNSLLTAKPYLGWRSQERLNVTDTLYKTPTERLADSLQTQNTSQAEVETSLREVTSAIQEFVNDKPISPAISPRLPRDQKSPSPSKRKQRVWVESSFVGSRVNDNASTPVVTEHLSEQSDLISNDFLNKRTGELLLA